MGVGKQQADSSQWSVVSKNEDLANRVDDDFMSEIMQLLVSIHKAGR
jgi:hypothetical protein